MVPPSVTPFPRTTRRISTIEPPSGMVKGAQGKSSILDFMRRLFHIIFLLLTLVPPTQASPGLHEVAGVRVSGHISLAGQNLVLNGAGLRRILFLKVYVAALYLPERQHDTRSILDRDIPRSLRVTLLRDLNTEQNIAALKGGLVDNNSPGELDAVQQEVAQFLAFLKGVQEVPAGTVIHLDYVPGEGTRVRVNDRSLGTVLGQAFNRALLRVWLGDEPVQASLKQDLLGG